jgi:Tfp pilus assembly protein PilO
MNLRSLYSDFVYGCRHPLAVVSFFIAAALLVVVVVLTAVWWPSKAKYRQLTAEVASLQSKIIDAKEAVHLLDAYEDAKIKVDNLQTKLQYAATQAQLISDVSGLARQHGVMIVNQSYDERSGKESVSLMSTELYMVGRYIGMRNFIADLPKLPTWTEVREVSLERARDGGEVRGRIQLVTYRSANGMEQK